MKKQEAILVSAFTGILLTKDFSDVQTFCEDLIGRPIFTHEFASNTLLQEIKEKCNPLIIEMIENETDSDRPTDETKETIKREAILSVLKRLASLISFIGYVDFPSSYLRDRLKDIAQEYGIDYEREVKA